MDRKKELKQIQEILMDGTTYFTPEECEKASIIIEDYTYAKVLEDAEKMHILSSEMVENLYNAKMYEIKINLDPKSSVNNIPNFLINKLYNSLFKEKMSLLLSNSEDMDYLLYLLNLATKFRFGENGYVHPSEIANLSPQELHPEMNMHIINEIEVKKQQTVETKTTSMYTCENCGGNDAEARSVETCSADEGATLFIECKKCGYVQRDYS